MGRGLRPSSRHLQARTCVSGINVECATFKVYPTGTGPYPGKYTFCIGGAKWEDLIWVYPGCASPQKYNQPTGLIEILAGDAYSWGGGAFRVGWIPPGGTQSFGATKLDDQDKCGVNIVHDTFTKAGAVTWAKTNNGSIVGTDAISLKATYTAPTSPNNSRINMSIKDDGLYAQDNANPVNVDFVGLSVYKLTGLTVKDAAGTSVASEVYWRSGIPVTVAPIEITNGGRPPLEYSITDEGGGNVEAPFVTTQASHQFVIPKPGHYKFHIKNVGRPSEFVHSNTYLYFTLKLDSREVVVNWDPQALTELGLEELKAKGRTLLENLRKLNTDVQLGNNATGATKAAFEMVLQKVTGMEQYVRNELTRNRSLLESQEAELRTLTRLIADRERSITNTLARAESLLAQSRQALAAGRIAEAQALLIRAGVFQALAVVERLAVEQMIRQQTTVLAAKTRTLAAIAELDRQLPNVRAALTEIRAAGRTAVTFDSMGSAIRNIANSKLVDGVGKFIGGIGILADIDSLIQNGSKIEAAIRAKQNADAIAQEYKALVDALSGAPRQPPPVEKYITIISQPGEIDFKLTGNGPSWRTTDSEGFEDRLWPHLTKLEDSLTNWDGKEWTTDSSGYKTFKVSFHGNLGFESFTVSRNAMSPDTGILKSEGSTENELLRRLEPALAAEKANLNIVQGLIDSVVDILDAILSAIGIFAALTIVGGFIVAALQIALAGVKEFIGGIIGDLNETELERNVKRNYPKE